MAGFVPSIDSVDFCGFPAWQLSTPEGSSALVAARGATLLSWQPRPGQEAIDGYESGKELEEVAGERSLVMAPWCGKIPSGSYSFAGKHIEVSPGMPGLLAQLDFVRVPAGGALRLVADVEASEAYPWPFTVSVIFSLDTGKGGFEHLSFTLDVTNRGSYEAPVALGWRPCVKMPGVHGISNFSLAIPARTKVVATKEGNPLPGDAAFAGVGFPVRVDYLGRQKIDQAFTDLVPNEDGIVTTSLTNPARGSQILLTQEPTEAPVVCINTGDELARASRGSVALSPRSALDNAANRADAASRLPLMPGHTRSLTATLTYKG